MTPFPSSLRRNILLVGTTATLLLHSVVHSTRITLWETPSTIVCAGDRLSCCTNQTICGDEAMAKNADECVAASPSRCDFIETVDYTTEDPSLACFRNSPFSIHLHLPGNIFNSESVWDSAVVEIGQIADLSTACNATEFQVAYTSYTEHSRCTGLYTESGQAKRGLVSFKYQSVSDGMGENDYFYMMVVELHSFLSRRENGERAGINIRSISPNCKMRLRYFKECTSDWLVPPFSLTFKARRIITGALE